MYPANKYLAPFKESRTKNLVPFKESRQKYFALFKESRMASLTQILAAILKKQHHSFIQQFVP